MILLRMNPRLDFSAAIIVDGWYLAGKHIVIRQYFIVLRVFVLFRLSLEFFPS